MWVWQLVKSNILGFGYKLSPSEYGFDDRVARLDTLGRSVVSRDDNFTRTRRIPTRMDKKVFCPLKFGLGSSKPKIKKSGSGRVWTSPLYLPYCSSLSLSSPTTTTAPPKIATTGLATNQVVADRAFNNLDFFETKLLC